MTQEQIDALPKHLEGIRFENWHFYKPKGSNNILLQDNFIDDVMRIKNINFTPKITRVIHIEGDKFYVEAKVTVSSQIGTISRAELRGNCITGAMEGDNDLVPITKETTAYASVTRMPSNKSDGQTHYCQLAITRALKTAVMRHLQITDHDVQLAIEAYEISLKKVSAMAITVTDDEPEETKVEDSVISEVDLGDLGV